MKPNFKTEWTREDFTNVRQLIVKYFKGKVFKTHANLTITMPDNYKAIEMVIGLPYTSSSSFAMQSLDCNVHLTCPDYRFENYHYSYVAISENGNVYLAIEDKFENEHYIQISKKITNRWELNEFVPQLQNHGFTVLFPSPKITDQSVAWIHFYKDGLTGHLTTSSFKFSGFDFGSSHKPCREYGTGLSTKRETWELTIDNANDAIKAKGWAGIDWSKIKRWSSPNEFVKSNEWAKYKILKPSAHPVPTFPVKTAKANRELKRIKKFGYGV